jgi:hypothetical protein
MELQIQHKDVQIINASGSIVHNIIGERVEYTACTLTNKKNWTYIATYISNVFFESQDCTKIIIMPSSTIPYQERV